MTGPVLVRSSMRTWDYNLLVLAGILLLSGGGIGAVFGNPLVCLLLAPAGVGLLLWAIIGRTRRARLRQWVQDVGDGFIITDHDGEHRVKDHDVLAMALTHKGNYSEGVLKSETRKFRVWLAGAEPAPEAVLMTNRIKVGMRDPLGGLIPRLGNMLFERAREELASGQAVLGECWTLEDRVLTVRMKGIEASCPVAELTAVDLVDRDICVWRRGQDEVFARVPARSANAYVLPRLLAERLPRQEPGTDGTAPATGLGRVLFERRPRRATVVSLAVFGILLLIAAGVIGVAAGLAGTPWALGCAAIAVIALLGALHARRSVFRCHQHGIHKAGLFRANTLRYAELASFSYTSMRHYHNGAYTGTYFRLRFEPEAGNGSRPIVHGVQLPHADQELEKLRDHVAQLIAARMTRQVADREPVRWTKRLRFLADGIEYQPRGFLRRPPPLVIPFGDVASYEIRDGKFFLWTREQKKAAIRESTGAANFYPGYYVLNALLPLVPHNEAAQKGEERVIPSHLS